MKGIVRASPPRRRGQQQGSLAVDLLRRKDVSFDSPESAVDYRLVVLGEVYIVLHGNKLRTTGSS